MWSIVEVARMSGVTARTLRHYDAIGLLPPAAIAVNGYRHYGHDELLRLQEILVLRALGLGLSQIGAVLDRRRDRVEALSEHHRRLLAERDRLSAMAETVARTLEDLGTTEGGSAMDDRPQDLFEGFDRSGYAREAQERWPEQYAESERRFGSPTEQDARRLGEEWGAQLRRMADLQDAGLAVDDPRVQDEVDGVFRAVGRMWTPDAASFAGLGRMYVDDERFAAAFERVRKGLAVYFRDAMQVYSDERLE